METLKKQGDILIVSDDTSEREFLQFLLEKKGHDCFVTAGTPSTSLLGAFEITGANNSANGTLVTLFIIILDQIASPIIGVTKAFTVIVISDAPTPLVDGVPAQKNINETLSYLQNDKVDLFICKEKLFLHSDRGELEKIEQEMDKVTVLMLALNGCIYWSRDGRPTFYKSVDYFIQTPVGVPELSRALEEIFG